MVGWLHEVESVWHGNSLWWGFCLFVDWKLLEHTATVDLEAYKSEAKFETNSMTKNIRKATWGKFTKNAYGARRFRGWTDEAIWDSMLFMRMWRLIGWKIVRLLKIYIQHCDSTMGSPKKENRPMAVISCCLGGHHQFYLVPSLSFHIC